MAHQIQSVYVKKSGANLGNKWAMKSASRVAFAECRLGNAPKTCGLAVNVLV